MRGLSRSRTITLLIAATILTCNGLSAFLFSRVSGDTHHLARVVLWYLFGASTLSIFGAVGAWMEHALSVSIYAAFLILDALLSTIPRISILAINLHAASDLCFPIPPDPPFSPPTSITSQSNPALALLPALQPPSIDLPVQFDLTLSPPIIRIGFLQNMLAQDPPPPDCQHIFEIVEFALCFAIVAAAVFQLWGAVSIRGYVRKLRARDASKAIERIYQDDEDGEDIEFGFPHTDDGVSSGDGEHDNSNIRTRGGPWTCCGEFAGGVIRWIR